MPSLSVLHTQLPFDPPPPRKPSALETAGTIAVGTGALVAIAVLHPLLELLEFFGLFVGTSADKQPFDVDRALSEMPEVAATRAPLGDGEGNMLCTRCSDIVPYASMSLNEDGYFCARCAARLTEIAVLANDRAD